MQTCFHLQTTKKKRIKTIVGTVFHVNHFVGSVRRSIRLTHLGPYSLTPWSRIEGPGYLFINSVVSIYTGFNNHVL